MRTILITLFAVAGVLATACGDDGASGSETRVVASTPQVADLARHVAGERAEITGVLSDGADPHEYEPRPSDAAALAEADLVFTSGGDLDLWMDEMVEASGTDARVVELLGHVETIEGGHEHAPGDSGHPDAGTEDLDPHWWQDPRNAALAVEVIRDELTGVDPGGEAEYERNAAAYADALRALDREIAACLQAIPPQERKLVTTHDSLGYFAHRYDLELIGTAIPALSTQAQPSAGETAKLVELIREEGAPAIFPEAGVDASVERAIADEAGVAVGGELWADTLGPEGSGAETYVDALASNAEAIADGLSGEPGSCRITAGG